MTEESEDRVLLGWSGRLGSDFSRTDRRSDIRTQVSRPVSNLLVGPELGVRTVTRSCKRVSMGEC